jgi:hypothetical protein
MASTIFPGLLGIVVDPFITSAASGRRPQHVRQLLASRLTHGRAVVRSASD